MARIVALRPRDCLRNPNQSSRCRRRKRSPFGGNRRSNRDSLSTSQPSKKLEMEQVKILKRGKELKAKLLFGGENNDLGLKLCSTARLGPDTDDVKKEIQVPELYAGSASIISPPPSSLPFPSFLARRNLMESNLRKLQNLNLT
ncbi:hypothetical protein BVRB_2g034820 [Beta vulgaris subsp. vulgaris]|uniref:uncharacterized protein LOC104886676 n=1 Tax=Beta vulgaris subsp. vulgaris TaxID=3555 RepID=UPI00054030AA|nr:uncharacterized protein LOC104886676 [Beta vulgaris subsp. vulgaris]KMT17730.1 hypothetical protein BVRB_2g034820 [Beta vulgaris subsp. vulgaris]